MIFDFKNLSAYGQALKTTSTDANELIGIMSELTLSQAQQALSSKKLSVDTMKQVLMTKGLTEAEALATATKLASASANGVATFSLKAYTIALWENIKAIGAWMLTNPVGWVIGLGVAIGGTIAICDLFNESIEEQKDKLKELEDEYKTAKDELSSLSTELENNIKLIKELQAKQEGGTITLVEEDQLEKLKFQNSLLSQQLKLKEDLAKKVSSELVKENRETFYNEFGDTLDKTDESDNFTEQNYEFRASEPQELTDQRLILVAKENEKRLNEAIKANDTELINSLKEDKMRIVEEINNRSDTILLTLLEYQNNIAEGMNSDGTFANELDEKMWNDIEDWKKHIYEYSNRSGEWNTIQIDAVLNTESLQSIQTELQKKLIDGELTKKDIEGYTELNNALKDSNLILTEGQDPLSIYMDYLRGLSFEQTELVEAIEALPDLSFEEILEQLEESHTSLTSLKEEIDELKIISVDTIQDLLSKYPSLTNILSDYVEGKAEEEEVVKALADEYAADLENYRLYIIQKHGDDEEFYDQVVDNLSEDLIKKAETYGIELQNYSTYLEAKLAMDKEYARKKYILDSAKEQYKATTIDSTHYMNPSISAYDNMTEAEQEVKDIEAIIDSVDTSIKAIVPDFNTQLFKTGESSDDTKEFSDSIDWAANSIENLTNKINKLNQSIENAPNYTKQLELTGKLLNKQKDLRDLLKKVRDESSDRYTDSLGEFSDSELAKYQPLIEGTEPVTLEMFEGEDQQELFEKVKAAQEAWQAYQQAILDYRKQVGVVADTQKQQYELEQEERQTVIDIETNKKNDIQNKIDKQETKYGYADEQLYQDLYDQNDIVLARNKEKLEKAKENRKNIAAKYGVNSEAYLEADNEVQDLQNNVSSLKQEQLELNRTILKYPIHKLEEAKELLEDQLEDVQKHKEKVTDAISAASELVQEQIDYYQDLRDTTSDSYDAQIENIQKQKDALTETNDALQQQISLEKARYNLDRAMNQKTVKILRNGEFVYEADADAIQEAQEALDQEEYNMAVSAFDTQIKNLEDEKQEALDGIDDQIEALTTYKENIDNIVSGYEQVLRLQSLISVFGKDAPQRILNGDTSIVQEMGNEYVDVASTEKTLQEQIDLYADEIEAIETYASTWTTSKDTIAEAKKIIEDIVKDTDIEFKAIADRNEKTKSVASEWLTTKQGIETELGLIESGQTIAKDNEAAILQKRLDALKYFATEATGYLNQVATALASAEQLQTEFNNKQKFLNTDDGAIIALNPNEAPEFHTGMENGFVGEKNTKDSFKNISLTKLKPDEIPAILKIGEGVLTKLQQTNVLDNMRTAFYSGIKLSNFNNIQKANNTTPLPSITFNGDIILQGVQDTENFAKKIKSEFLTKLSQELYK